MSAKTLHLSPSQKMWSDMTIREKIEHILNEKWGKRDQADKLEDLFLGR